MPLTKAWRYGSSKYGNAFKMHNRIIYKSTLLHVVFACLLFIRSSFFTHAKVGLAVGDIQQIQKEAELRKLALQVYM